MRNHQVIPTKIAGHKMLLDASGVLFWPAQDLLVFSDIHFEKASFLSQFAHPLPRFDTADSIVRMAKVIEIYAPKIVICLGDSFHDGNAFRRMELEKIEQLNTLVTSMQKWVWVLGNHDPDIPNSIVGERKIDFTVEALIFSHEPVVARNGESHFQVIGHYHPKVSTVLSRHKVTGCCFVCSDDVLILPAFGTFTGGLNVQSDAISALIHPKEPQYFLIYRQKIYRV